MNCDHISDKNEISSEVENTLTLDCFLNAFSLDQIAALNERAKAKYCTSLACGAKNTSKVLPLDSKAEKTVLASTTTNTSGHFFKDSLNLLANDSSTFSANSSTSFSVNSLFATIAFNSSILSNCALSNFLTTTCYSISGNSSISSFNSSGILIVNSPICITCDYIDHAYIKHFLPEERTCAKKKTIRGDVK